MHENGYARKMGMNLLSAVCRAQVHTKIYAHGHSIYIHWEKHSAIIGHDCSLKILKAANQKTVEFSTGGFLTGTFLSIPYNGINRKWATYTLGCQKMYMTD